VSPADDSERVRRLEERLRVLSGAVSAFAEATTDVQRLLDTVAIRVAEVIKDLCVVLLLDDDGTSLMPAAMFDSDPRVLGEAREAFSEPLVIATHLFSRGVIETGAPFFAPKIELEVRPDGSSRGYELFRTLGVHSLVVVPLRARERVIGELVLARFRPDSAPFEEHDLELAQALATHATLAIANARSFAAERAARDAAERATTALRQAERRFSRLFESGILGIVIVGFSGRVHEANDAVLDLLGYGRQEILSGEVAWKDLTPPEWRPGDERAIEELTTSGIASLREKEYIRKDGTRAAVLVGTAMLEGGSDQSISFVLDLTTRNEARAAVARLREEAAAHARLHALLESAPDAMVIVGSSGAIELVNAQVEVLFGYTRAELIGQPIEVLLPDRFRNVHPAVRGAYFEHAAVRAMGAGMELYARRKDATEFPIEVSLAPLQTESGLLVSSAIRDITERKRADQQRMHLAAIVDSSADTIIGKALDGTIRSWNLGAERTFGYSAAEIIGTPISRIIPPGREHEESIILETMARGEAMQFETVRRRKDGRDIDVSVTVSPVRDSTGRVVGVSKVVRDITEQKRAELALAQAKDSAEAASRELEAFSYSVAHDLRAPLRGMNGFAQVLLDRYGDKFDAAGKDWLEEICLNATKMGALIDALLSLSRVTRSEVKRESVDLSALVRAAATRLHATEPERAVEVVVQDGLRADLDPTLARALIDNLVGNAWKFTRKAPSARIELGAADTDGPRTFFVRDNGAGFDMAYASKLFAPFQRLHTADEFPGTGIGLATVERIVRRHGGRLWADGAVDAGATFYFTVPSRTPEATS
jgi:PAS domain S-box-containing protein